MDKTYLPEGISEDKFVEIVEKVSLASAYKYVFGYHDVIDLQQKAMEIAIGLMGYNLLITDEMPKKSNRLVVVATIDNQLYFRIFNSDGNIVIDTSEAKLPNINHIKEAIKEYHPITNTKRNQIIKMITDVVGYKAANSKFKPRGDKPMEKQLAAFLRVWIHNRLSNYRRDNSCRYPNNGGSNQVKYNLMHCLKLHSQGLTNSEIFARESYIPERLSMEEILQRIASGLKPRNRQLYHRYIEGEELSEVELNKLFKAIKKILPGDAEEYL